MTIAACFPRAAPAVLLAALVLFRAHSPLPAAEADLQPDLLRPPDECRPLMRWWWFGPAVTRSGLECEMQAMKEGGIGGFDVQPVYALSLDDESKKIRNLASLAALMAERGDPSSKDPLGKLDTGVKAVGVFFPPTNFLDWNGVVAPGVRVQDLFFGDRAAHTPEETAARARELSPALLVKAPTPPFLVIHGDADMTVPLQQSRILVDAIKAAGGTAELIVKAGGGHAWLTISEEVRTMSDWFDRKLSE